MAGGMCGRGVCMVGGVCGRGACMAKGTCMAGQVCCKGHAWQGGCVWQGACVAGEMATAVDGTHLTGMHTCSRLYAIMRSTTLHPPEYTLQIVR